MFHVKNLDLDQLHEIIYHANKGKVPVEFLRKCNHVKYLRSYLGPNGLDAKFYAEEKDYINYDYLSDYSYYYSRSFTEYSTKCVRIHFFNSNFTLNEFNTKLSSKLLKGPGTDKRSRQFKDFNDFWHKNYLGFIVIRPIPAYLGFAILKHYNYFEYPPQKIVRYDTNRNFWGVRDYIIHICGNPIKINDSLAFMSQDGNVAACATIAIWCMLHRAVENYFINLKSPYEITKDVGDIISTGDRTFPNSGLDLVSMCSAVAKSNLAPIPITFFDNDTENPKSDANRLLKMYINAYSGLHIPIILALNVYSNGQYDGHAVAICGHSHAKFKNGKTKIAKNINKEELILYSDNIEKLFAHDDQHGPFSKIIIKGQNKLYTSWSSNVNSIKKNDRPAFPIALLIPVFQKVRISFDDIYKCTLALHDFLVQVLYDEINTIPSWNIQIKYSTDFKSEIINKKVFNLKSAFEKAVLYSLLNESFPKYIWVTTFYYKNEALIYFIYDATALKHSDSLLASFSYDLIFWKEIIDVVHSIKDQNRTVDDNVDLFSYFSTTVETFFEKVSKLYNKAKLVHLNEKSLSINE